MINQIPDKYDHAETSRGIFEKTQMQTNIMAEIDRSDLQNPNPLKKQN